MFVPPGPLGQKQHSRGHNTAMPCTTAVPRPKPCEENKRSCVSRCSCLQDWICYEGPLSLSNNSVLVWPRHRLRYAGTRPFVQPCSSTGQWFVFLIFKLLSPGLLTCFPVLRAPALLHSPSACLRPAFCTCLDFCCGLPCGSPQPECSCSALCWLHRAWTIIPSLFVFCKLCFFRFGSDLLTCHMFFSPLDA